jgi:hypothetical protein
MHVTQVVRKHTTAAGEKKEYKSVILRRSYREGGKVRSETLANLTALPDHAIDALRAALSGKTLLTAGEDLKISRSLPHGHVAAVAAQAKQLRLPALLGPACPERDLVLALIIARVVRPGSKLATTTWWTDTTLAADLGITDATTDDVYAAMDWLAERQETIEAKLAARHLEDAETNPHRLAMFDLSSSWMTGNHCPLAARGYSRDGKKGLPQIEYGLLTDPAGRPVAVQVFPGNTADPTAFTAITETIKHRFGLEEMVLVGDRGMITNARVNALKELGGYGWVTALRAPAIAKLAADDGPLQLPLFDQADLAEISHPDYPGERLVACRNPALAAERARKRVDLLAATDAALDKIQAAVAAGRLTGADQIGIRVGKVINRYKMSKHYDLNITNHSFTYSHDQARIDAEVALDGIYIIRTTIPTSQMDSAQVVDTYKNLSRVERDFRSLKSIDLDLRPIHHRTEARVRAHVFICMLASYLTWHLREAWKPLTFTDENRPTSDERDSPVAPAQRSESADLKAASKTTTDQLPAMSFNNLLTHLGTLTRNQIQVTDQDDFDLLADPTDIQRRAFELLNTKIPVKVGK